jgi:acetoin utilization deacetylase AcuC-like enzyme
VSRTTALVMHSDCARHDTGWAHPEHQGRLPAIVNALYRDTPDLIDHVRQVEGAPASWDDIRRVHDEAMIRRVRDASAEAERTGALVRLDADTVVSPASQEAALAAVGCALTAAAMVWQGSVPTAFAMTRPPGHHATVHHSMGFCLFNNVAIAARALQAVHGAERVLIVDWDVHHGNGTQDIFYSDPSVYYLSLHLDRHYPGSGAESERGTGAGLGFTRNVTFAEGTSADEYVARFRAAMDATLAEFEPDVILVSAGFDCLAGDPLGGLLLEPEHLYALTRDLLERAEANAGGRLVLLLEGGYSPKRVGEAVRECVRALSGLPATSGN